MENKQLNFSAPLLSARRYSSPLRSSEEHRKNEPLPAKMSKGEVVKPGSVPFLWEQIPGRAKGDSRLHCEEEAPTTTRGGRFVRSGDLTSFYKSQNRLSGELNLRYRLPLSGELNLIRPQGGSSSSRLSGELRPAPNRLHSLPIPTNEMAMRTLLMDGFDRTGGGGGGAGGSGSRSQSDDGDTAFSDAIDALESFSMKCSTTGLSASDNHQTPMPVEPLSSQSESDNLEFMINRFLPAAKAMTLDSSPHYATKRQLVVVERPPPQPQLSKAIIPKIVKESAGFPTPTPKQQDLSMYYTSGLDIGSQRSESHDDYEDDSSDDFKNSKGHGGVTVKSCGFFPWFCSKNALRLLNPVPAMRVKTKNALASATKVGRNLVRNASPSRSFSKQQQQQVSRTSRVYKVGSSITKSCELRQTETYPPGYYKPRPMFYSGELPSTRTTDSHTRNGHLSPYRNYRRTSVVSPCRNESPRSPYHHHQSTTTGPGYFIVPKRVDQSNYPPKPTNNNSSNSSGPILSNRRNYPQGSPVMVEKTFYVDSTTAKLTKSRQSSGRIDILKARGLNNKPLVCGSLDASPPSPYHNFAMKNSHSFNQSRREQDHHPQHKKLQNACKEMVVLKTEDLTALKLSSSSPAVASPPLPKSPSESWLSRNLNSVSPRNSFGGHSNDGGGAKVQSRKQQSTRSGYPGVGSVKWETIVKSTYLMSDHGLYPEVVVPKQTQTRK